MAETSAEEPEKLRQTAIEPLGVYTEALAAIDDRAQSAFGASDAPWLQALADDFALNRARSVFITQVTAATVAGLTGGDPTADLAADAEARAEGEVVIRRRHAALWSPCGETILVEGGNHTLRRAREGPAQVAARSAERLVLIGLEAETPAFRHRHGAGSAECSQGVPWAYWVMSK